MERFVAESLTYRIMEEVNAHGEGLSEPRIEVQKFVPDEYVAACYTLVCAIPGTSSTEINDGTKAQWFNEDVVWGGNTIHADHLQHGNCGNNSTSYDVDHSVGYEHNNDGTVKNAKISDITIGSPQSANSNIYYANWISTWYDNIYRHYGFAIMNESKPNHS